MPQHRAHRAPTPSGPAEAGVDRFEPRSSRSGRDPGAVGVPERRIVRVAREEEGKGRGRPFAMLLLREMA